MSKKKKKPAVVNYRQFSTYEAAVPLECFWSFSCIFRKQLTVKNQFSKNGMVKP
jgi:hypothetical protein